MKKLCKALLMLVFIIASVGKYDVQASQATLEVYEDGELITTCENMMDAFGAMTDSDKAYTVKITDHTVKYYIEGDFVWPEVKSITIEGNFDYLYFNGNQTFNCDVTLSHIHFVQANADVKAAINIQGNKLTVDKQSSVGAEFYSVTDLSTNNSLVNVIGEEGSVIEITGESFVSFYCNMDVERLILRNGDANFRGSNALYNLDFVDVYKDYNIELLGVTKNGSSYGGQTVNIGKYSYLGNYSNAYVFVEDESKLVIDTFYSAVSDFELCIGYSKYSGLPSVSDITISGELTNVASIYVQIQGTITGASSIADVIELESVIYAPQFTGDGSGIYSLRCYDDNNTYCGDEGGTFSLYALDGHMYLDKESFKKSYDNRKYYCGDYQYSINNSDGAVIHEYSGAEVNLVIPEELDGHKVVAVSSIGKSIKNMETITLPATLETVGEYAFGDTNYGLGNTDYKLIAINVAEGSSTFKSIDGVLYSYDEKILYRCPLGKESVDIPDSVERIEKSAFNMCTKIKRIVLPDSVKYIGTYAFARCTSLEYVRLSANLREIIQRAFIYCYSLKEVVFPSVIDKVYVGEYAFGDCTSLKSIYLPGEEFCALNVSSFSNCSKLENIVFLNNEITFGDGVSDAHEAYESCADNFKVYCKLGTEAEAFIRDEVRVTYADVSEAEPFVIYEDSINLKPGETYYMPVYRNPYDAATLTWTSDNEAVAVVNADGTITAVNFGKAVITVTDGVNSACCTVNICTDITVSAEGIYVVKLDRKKFSAGLVAKPSKEAELQYRWIAYNKTTQKELILTDWTDNNQWLDWEPESFGEYVVTAQTRVKYNPSAVAEVQTEAFEFNPHIKGKCQMPYEGEGGGFLIGVESYENPNQEYYYEMLILDCTLLAEGKDAWVYTTGLYKVSEGCAGWCIWQPQYGYYWTLFRVYDKDGNMIDQACYGFQNI